MKKIPFWTCLTLSLAFIALLWYQAPAQAQETADPDPADASTPPPSQEPPTQQLPNSTKLEGTVVRVVDPDTIEVNLSNGKREKVRLLQIQVPTGRSCGPEAMDRINELILGKTVQLELDAKKRDQEGRLLAYVYVNGKSVQQALLNEGLAKVSSSSQGKYADQYRAFEDHAKALEKGVWASNPCGKGEDSTASKARDSNQNDHNQSGMMEQQKAGNSGGPLPKTGTQHPTQALLGAGILLAGLWLRRRTA